jgi:hypothetical protein
MQSKAGFSGIKIPEFKLPPKTLYDKSKQNFDAKKNGLDLSGIDAELARRGIK